MSRKNDFTPKTKNTLRDRVAGKCSNPGCCITTIGPHSVDHKALSKGCAAHIRAAEQGAARFDDKYLTPKNIQNGIWLCRNCHDLVDKDESEYPVELLESWKEQAERRAENDLRTNHPRPHQPLSDLALKTIVTASKGDGSDIILNESFDGLCLQVGTDKIQQERLPKGKLRIKNCIKQLESENLIELAQENRARHFGRYNPTELAYEQYG